MEEANSLKRIDHLKPVMKVLPSFKSLKITSDLIVQVKVDGEFTYMHYKEGEAYTLNRYGKARKDFPALNELTEALKKSGIREAELLSELYAKEGEKPLKLPDFIHYIKSGNPDLLAKIHIGIFDLLTVNGRAVRENYAWKVEEMERWLKDCRLVAVLPYIKPSSTEEIEEFWKRMVEELGYEGLVARSNMETYKIKPYSEVDAVVIGFKETPSTYERKEIRSLRVALIDQDGTFIELCDVSSGIDHALAKRLFNLYFEHEELQAGRVEEAPDIMFIKPLIIATVRYTDIYRNTKNGRYRYENGKYKRLHPDAELVKLRHPRLVRFRPDKQPTPRDAGLNQIPL